MNCTQFNNMLDEYIDGALSPIQVSHVQLHLNRCEQCQNDHAQAKELLSALQDIQVPPAQAGYEKRVLSFLEKNKEKSKKHHNGFYAGFGTAIAASFVLWLVFSPVSILTDSQDKITTVNLLVQKEKSINLVFNLANELSNATLTIDLPEKVEIAGYAGKRQLSWKTSFVKGANRLILPLVAVGKNSGLLIAHLSKDGVTKKFQIQINTQSPPTSSFLKVMPLKKRQQT